jgi:hypothetical protein
VRATHYVWQHIPVDLSVGENEPFPGLRICADADPQNVHWIAFYWTAILSIEAILMSLAVYKVRR